MIGTALATAVVLIAFLVLQSERHGYHVHTSGIILITGASTGIGRDAAEYLATNFNYLVLAGVRKEVDYNAIKEKNTKNLVPFIIDVSVPHSLNKAVSDLKMMMDQHNLPFIGLVNNAGVGAFSPLEFQDIAGARSLFDANVFGVLHLTQLTLPLLRSSKGRIVNLSSLSGIVSSPFSGLYAASKFAVEALSDSLRREVAPHGVSVSIIEPGYVKTQIMQSALKNGDGVRVEPVSEEWLAVYPASAKRDAMAVMIETMPGPASTTTPAIVDALTAAFPKTRYPVAQAGGLGAKVLSWIVWATTDRIKDFIFQK